MPVRFRCRHCRQLLGIARRKAGAEVTCPTCHNRVTVPAADAPDADEPTAPRPPSLEGAGLDSLLQLPSAGPPPATASAPPTGVALSPRQAVLLTLAVALLLALFFAAGLLIGRFWF